MLKPLSCSQVRQVDQDAIRKLGLPSLLLMENAARGVCDRLRLEKWNSITIFAGPGNNGGDGLAVARQLAASGIQSTIALIRGDKRLSTDAAENLSFLRNSDIEVVEPDLDHVKRLCESLTKDDLIVDALLGTGIRGRVSSPFAETIQFINSSLAEILAVDVPSGLDCDLGIPCGVCVRAQTTVTFVARKQGFLAEGARQFTGRVEVCHIGIPQKWLESWLREWIEPGD